MVVLICRGWDQLFRIQEPVFWEVLLEFYATFSLDPTKPLNDWTAVFFFDQVVLTGNVVRLTFPLGLEIILQMRRGVLIFTTFSRPLL